jgi:hypothetical protein
MLVQTSAIIFTALTAIVVIFQGCLAAGVPWGKASMGGKYPGEYPPKMKVVAMVNMVVLSFFALIIISKADILLPQLKQVSRIGIWIVVGFFSLSTVMNSITPSKIERIWAPVAFIQLAASIIVAIN